MGNLMWLYGLTYISFFVLLCGTVARAVRYHRQPVHLRWELHIAGRKDSEGRGGSRFEHHEWWNLPRKKKLAGELKYMAGEILLFRECYRTKRSLWYFTYSLHLGLYLGILWIILVTLGAVLTLAHIEVSAGSTGILGRSVYLVTIVCGVSAFFLGSAGSLGLFIRRLTNDGVKLYSAPADYANLCFLGALFLSGLSAWYSADPTFDTTRKWVVSLLTLGPTVHVPPALVLFLTVLCLFILYMPFTPMMHFVAKYFMYHRVRWDDEPNIRGGNLEKELQDLLGQKLTWSGRHIKPDSTWLDSALDTTIHDNRDSDNVKG